MLHDSFRSRGPDGERASHFLDVYIALCSEWEISPTLEGLLRIMGYKLGNVSWSFHSVDERWTKIMVLNPSFKQFLSSCQAVTTEKLFPTLWYCAHAPMEASEMILSEAQNISSICKDTMLRKKTAHTWTLAKRRRVNQSTADLCLIYW
jgi:hypothetical protein